MADDEKPKSGAKASHAGHGHPDEEKKSKKPEPKDAHAGHAHAGEEKKPKKPEAKGAEGEDKGKQGESDKEKEDKPAAEKKEEDPKVKESPRPERRLSKAKERKLKAREKKAKRELKPGEIPVLGIDGIVIDAVKPPVWFSRVPYRPDVIRRAVVTMQANRRQVYGPPETSGMRHAVYWWGKGRGVSRTPRLKGSSRGAQAPNTVGGRRAHPPKLTKDYSKKLNHGEMRLARLSAMRAAADPKLVAARGHKFSEETFIPVVVEDEMEKLVSTVGEMVPLLKKAGIYADVLRAEVGRHVRPGRGKMRGRRYRGPKSILFIVRDPGAAPAATNLAGADVKPVSSVNVEDLAPGGDAGRLVVFSKSAFEEVSKWQ
jgi:large subunit ribosomal protein L4e